MKSPENNIPWGQRRPPRSSRHENLKPCGKVTKVFYGSDNKASAYNETQVQSLGWGDLLEKEMATHSSILAWKIPWMEEPGRLQSTGCKELDTTEQLHFTSRNWDLACHVAKRRFFKTKKNIFPKKKHNYGNSIKLNIFTVKIIKKQNKTKQNKNTGCCFNWKIL